MINLQDVTKVYQMHKDQRVTAVQGVDVTIADGEFIVITGRSGSGKTTLLNLIAGLTRPTQGKIYLDGTDLWALSDHDQSLLRNQKIGFVFQFPSLLPSLNSLENVILPTLFYGHELQNEYARAKQLLKMVGLEDKTYSLPRQLSAGQQQRVVIARSLMFQPKLILADEPTSNLDEKTECEIMNLFSRIHRDTGVTVVMVTHTSQLISYGTRSIEMAAGQITA
jgi:ABC-type lipoprotein export system ATPase subunit